MSSHPFPWHTLMIQGTTSDAGKSTVVAALCRLLARKGVRVAPFKPQNMALNSAVTVDGGEIGRAQALQAQAAGIPAHTDMNPVLLKPSSDTGAQVIIHGKVRADMNARDYHQYKVIAMSSVLDSYQRLQSQYDVILVEGAGSPAEINLREHDIANMGFAEAVDCPVILVADIDRGGVFAHLIGTLDCLSESERQRIIGFVINRFRGDVGLLQPGIDWLQQRTGKPVLAVLPYLQGMYLDAEDALQSGQSHQGAFRIVVPVLPRISNHTDFDALRACTGVDVLFIREGQSIPAAYLIILPGSKNTRNDLAWLISQGWPDALRRHLRYGGKVLGICGGFQMLGKRVSDPWGVEGEPGDIAGLGLLDMETELIRDKTLKKIIGECLFVSDVQTKSESIKISAYEIHVGISTGPALEHPAFHIHEAGVTSRAEGACSQDGQIMGSYLHGIFETPQALAAMLMWAGLADTEVADIGQLREQSLERIADTVEPLYEALCKD